MVFAEVCVGCKQLDVVGGVICMQVRQWLDPMSDLKVTENKLTQ